MKQTSLYFKDEKSNKEYHVQLEQSGEGYVVNFQYGRIGSTLQTGQKTKKPVSLVEAEEIYDKIIKEKTSKGYKEGFKKNDFSNAALPDQNEQVYILPQLLNAIDDVDHYINNDNFIAQEKKDGERRIIVADIDKNGVIHGLNKKGKIVQLPNTITNSISTKCILDGEIIGNIFFVFDILSINGEELTQTPLLNRLDILGDLKFGNNIKIVQTAYTKKEKRRLFEILKENNKEGIVFKHMNSPYISGRPNSGGNQLKHKFVKTATFIVASHTKDKSSIGLEMIDESNNRVHLGKCTIPVSHKMPDVGSFVEVEYLYAYKDGCIFQPVYLNERNDCDLTDITTKQLVYKAE